MKKLITLIAITAVLTACGGGGGGSDDTDNNDSNNENISNDDINTVESSALAGNTWELCNQFTATSSQYPQVYTETEYFANYNTFTNDNCTGTPHTSSELSSGTYTVGSTVVTSGGISATEIDFHVTSLFGAPLPPAEQYTLYDIYYIDNDLLYFGDERAESAADRPNTIDFSDAYVQDL